MYMTMAPNQPKLTADWFTLRMSHHAHTASKNGPCRKDQHALGGKGLLPVNFRMATDHPHIPWYNPIHQSDGVGDRCTNAGKPTNHPQRALSPRATSVVNPETSSATAPTRTLSRRQRQYRDVRKVPVSTNHLRVHRQKTQLLV